MTINELHTQILTAKSYLNTQMVKIKTQHGSNLNYREINDRLDMIHEIERIGYRNLSENRMRKVTKMIGSLGIDSDN